MKEVLSDVATVLQQEGDRVRVSHRGRELDLPMVGFPPGFKLRAGERVAVFGEPVARPLVQATVAGIDVNAFEERGQVNVGGRDLALQSSTVLHDGDSDQDVVWVVEPGDSVGPPQIIAARRAR